MKFFLVYIKEIAGVALVVSAIFYAVFVEPNWIEFTYHKTNTDLGIRIVQLSDLHLHGIGNREREIAQDISNLQPSLIVITGDAVDHAGGLKEFDEFLALLPNVTVIGVLGNWEYWSDTDFSQLKTLYENRNGSRLLVNESINLLVNNKSLQIIGLDDFTAGRPDSPWNEKTKTVDGSIVLEHSPALFDDNNLNVLSGQYSLCLAGHTHAGQVTFFGFPIWTPRGSGKFKSGMYETPHCPVYVSRGVGTSILHMRFGARPEIAIFDM